MERSVEYFLNLIRRSQRGRFKVYIGMIAGVGKSYRMLQETRQLIDNGIDVKIGYIETHGREDTIRQMEGLPVIERRRIFYKGKELDEMDLEVILRERPEVVVVDELAHSNVYGSKNQKRWEDVFDILDAGINVISAVNIQHIESLNQEVENITGIEVKERIPDRIIEMADEVVNLDLTAEELIVRLKSGKIYGGDKIHLALSNFFTAENILQLRELALKEVAFRVEKKIEQEISVPKGPRQAYLLVCISSAAKTPRKLIRKGARLSARFNARFGVLYVRTPKEQNDNISLAHQRYLINNFKLATELGAEVIQTDAPDVVNGILDVCRSHQVSILCIGRPKWRSYRFLLAILRYRSFIKALEKMETDLFILS